MSFLSIVPPIALPAPGSLGHKLFLYGAALAAVIIDALLPLSVPANGLPGINECVVELLAMAFVVALCYMTLLSARQQKPFPSNWNISGMLNAFLLAGVLCFPLPGLHGMSAIQSLLY
jgi:hypothetical protein